MRYLLIFAVICAVIGCNKKVIVKIEPEGDYPVVINYEEGKTEVKRPPTTLITKKKIKGEIEAVFYFGFDKDFLPENQMERLIKFANTIPEGYLVLCVGGCCPIGTDEYNMDLGFNRAKGVQFSLSNLIKNEIIINSYGENDLKSDDPLQYSLNRRVEVYAKREN